MSSELCYPDTMVTSHILCGSCCLITNNAQAATTNTLMDYCELRKAAQTFLAHLHVRTGARPTFCLHRAARSLASGAAPS